MNTVFGVKSAWAKFEVSEIMLKKEYVGKTVHLKHFSVLVCEENIPTLKKLDIDWVFETKKKKKNDSDK